MIMVIAAIMLIIFVRITVMNIVTRLLKRAASSKMSQLEQLKKKHSAELG
jgi:hypothetical protein